MSQQLNSTYDVVRLRLEGLCNGLGVERETIPVWECWDHSEDAGERAALGLLAAHPDVTAVACTTDILALGALRAAARRGIGVPAELSVTGFDDVPEATAAGLTTVAQPHAEKGRAAWRLFTREDRDKTAAVRETISTELVVRGTTDRPRNGSLDALGAPASHPT